MRNMSSCSTAIMLYYLLITVQIVLIEIVSVTRMNIRNNGLCLLNTVGKQKNVLHVNYLNQLCTLTYSQQRVWMIKSNQGSFGIRNMLFLLTSIMLFFIEIIRMSCI